MITGLSDKHFSKCVDSDEKLHVNISWYFPVGHVFCCYINFLHNLFKVQRIKCVQLCSYIFTFLYAVNLAVWGMVTWGQCSELRQSGFENLFSSLVNAGYPFLSCFPPVFAAGQHCEQPGNADEVDVPQHYGLALQLVFCNHTVIFPACGGGTLCSRQVPLRGWADILDHINLGLRRAQYCISLFCTL